MALKHLMIELNWYGPYRDVATAREAARDEFDSGLYMVIGRCQQQQETLVQYIGISNHVHTRLNNQHHKLWQIVSNKQIWLGEITTAEPGGKKLKATPATLDCAEWLHARFMQLPLNEKKIKSLPKHSVTLLNRWWTTDEIMRKRRPHPDWPDLIDYPPFERPARMVWFGGKQRRFEAPKYANP